MSQNPLVVYGTINGNHGQTRLQFQLFDPAYAFPMMRKAYVVIYSDPLREFWGLGSEYERRARAESEQVFRLVWRLRMIKGLVRLWVTRNSLVIDGDGESFPAIAEVIKQAMTEVFRSFNFEEVLHGELDPALELMYA